MGLGLDVRLELKPPALPFISCGSLGDSSVWVQSSLWNGDNGGVSPQPQGCHRALSTAPGSEETLKHEILKWWLVENALKVSNYLLFGDWFQLSWLLTALLRDKGRNHPDLARDSRIDKESSDPLRSPLLQRSVILILRGPWKKGSGCVRVPEPELQWAEDTKQKTISLSQQTSRQRMPQPSLQGSCFL